LSVSSSDVSKINTYNFILTGTLTGDTQSTTSAFTVDVYSECYLQTLTAETTNSGVCTVVTYTLKDVSGNAIDSSVFTYDASSNKLTVSTTDTSKIGTYTFTLKGVLTGDVQEDSTNFIIYVHNECYGSVITTSS
jgi:hypothetical protein